MDFSLQKKAASLAVSGPVAFNVDMADKTTFRCGGKASLYFTPLDREDLFIILDFLKQEKLPFFILGGGSNILVADEGISGAVIDLTSLKKVTFKTQEDQSIILKTGAGLKIDNLMEVCAENEISGLEFLSGLPGTVGGAVYMNARCYGKQISDVLLAVEYFSLTKGIQRLERKELLKDFDYKKSPFQDKGFCILEADFKAAAGTGAEIRVLQNQHRADRKNKGHYQAPCAGSVFKNNRKWGKPSGQIIDELALKGRLIGDAQVAPWHGNIIINRGTATAKDILALIKLIEDQVKKARGISLEREIILVGDWPHQKNAALHCFTGDRT